MPALSPRADSQQTSKPHQGRRAWLGDAVGCAVAAASAHVRGAGQGVGGLSEDASVNRARQHATSACRGRHGEALSRQNVPIKVDRAGAANADRGDGSNNPVDVSRLRLVLQGKGQCAIGSECPVSSNDENRIGVILGIKGQINAGGCGDVRERERIHVVADERTVHREVIV